MLVSDILTLIRYATKDMSDDVTSVYNKLVAVNRANRVIRDVIKEYKPSLLDYTETQNTMIGAVEYTLIHKPNKIKTVRIAGTKIDPANKDDIRDLSQTGKPKRYYMSSFDKISFWPIPDAVYAFSVYMVEGSTDWNETDTVPYTADLADIIVEYSVGLLIGNLNEDVIRIKVSQYLTNLEPDTTRIRGYWELDGEVD